MHTYLKNERTTRYEVKEAWHYYWDLSQ